MVVALVDSDVTVDEDVFLTVIFVTVTMIVVTYQMSDLKTVS